MASIATKIRKSNVSGFVNCWRVQLNEQYYMVMPAHVAIYKKNGSWIKSDFLNKCGGNNWSVSKNWTTNLNLQDDFAWSCDLLANSTGNNFDNDKHNSNYLFKSQLSLTDPIDAHFYYRQPFDLNGKIQNTASLGKTIGSVYTSPSDDLKQKPLLEAVNIGFTGFSGSVAVDHVGDFIGMFVRAGFELGQRNVDISNDLEFIKKNPLAKRGVIIPHTTMEQHINEGGVKINFITSN